MLAYLGAPARLDRLLLEPAHSLLHQSWAPRYQTHGVVNADGFGVGWYDHAARREPALYRRTQPIWSDASLASIAGLVASPAVLAAVRSATPGSPAGEEATPPFASGEWLFAHNGMIEGWRAEPGAAVRALLSARRAAALQSTVDSEALFGLVLGRIDAGADPAEALASAIVTVKEIAGGRFTCLLTDGLRIWGTAWGNSLFVRRDGEGVLLASEPIDERDDWQPVPDVSMIEATADTVRIQPLGTNGE